jgi:hypothetical protein
MIDGGCMNVEEIKQWLDPVVNDQMHKQGDEPPDWPATKEKLIEALVTVGIDEETAKSMFTNADPSLRILEEITSGYEDTQLVLNKGAASITPWNNSQAFNWEGWCEGGSINVALILLVLCAKCNPLGKLAWGEEIVFYINAEWQKKQYGVTY